MKGKQPSLSGGIKEKKTVKDLYTGPNRWKTSSCQNQKLC